MQDRLKDSRNYRRCFTGRTENCLLIAACTLLSLIVLLNSSCGKSQMPPKLTIRQADELVRGGAPIGSSAADVIRFLDSLRIDAVDVVHGDYRDGEPYGDDRPEKVLPEMRGYLLAAILDVQRHPETYSTINIRINFYFDEARRLIDYKIWEQGDKL